MDMLADIIQRIGNTQKAMRTVQEQMGEAPPEPSLQAAYASLDKRHRKLEEAFLALAEKRHEDVCSYRLLPEGEDRYPIGTFGRALDRFQRWFSSVYDAIKNGPKKSAKLSAEVLEGSRLNFSFSYPGSLGVAMTIPSERLLVDSELQTAMHTTGRMALAATSGDIHEFAEQLGAPPIRALYSWTQEHVNGNLGADVHWMRGHEVLDEFAVGSDRFRRLKRAIEETSQEEETVLEVTGVLVGADTENHTFHMVFEEAEEIRGTMSESIGIKYTVELPSRYSARICKTWFVNYATDEEKTRYHLEALKPA